MIKVDIVNEVSRIADITKVKAEVAVDAVFEAMRISMQRGERIELRGFGVFQVKPGSAGSAVTLAPVRKSGFRPGAPSASSPAKTSRTSEADRFPAAPATVSPVPAPVVASHPAVRPDGRHHDRDRPRALCLVRVGLRDATALPGAETRGLVERLALVWRRLLATGLAYSARRPRHPGRARDGALPRLPPLRRRRDAALLPAVPVAVGHAWAR